MADSRYAYLLREVSEAEEAVALIVKDIALAKLEPDSEQAYKRLMECFHKLHDVENTIFCTLHVECPVCGDASAREQPSDCPCCGTLNSSIPLHLSKQLEAIWLHTAGPVVTCPICDGECEVRIDDLDGMQPCPTCGGAGALEKEDASTAIREMHYEAQGFYDDDDVASGVSREDEEPSAI